MKALWQVIRVLMLFPSLVITSTPAPGQTATQAHKVHYPSAQGNRVPDFRGTTVAINFNGPLGAMTRELLGKKGVEEFSEGSDPCNAPYPVVCVTPGSDLLGTTNGAGGFSNYGSNGGYSTYGSFSGELYSANVVIVLRRPSEAPIPLGYCSTITGAGYSSEQASSYNRNSSGTFYSQGSTLQSTAIGSAVGRCLQRLFNDSGWRKVWQADVHRHWYPGSAELIAETFNQ